MNSNTLDLLASLQINNSSNKSYRSSSNSNSSKSFQDILNNKQQTQDRFSNDDYHKRNDYKRDDVRNTRKDKDYTANYYTKPNITSSQNDTEATTSANNKLDEKGKVDSKNVDNISDSNNVEDSVKEIESKISAILNLLQQLSNPENSDSISAKDIELLAGKLEELIHQLEAITQSPQAFSTKLQGMSTELINALEKLMAGQEQVGLNDKQIATFKDVLDKLNLNNLNQNNTDINAEASKDDNKIVLVDQKESSQGNANDENSKAFDKNENSLLSTSSNSNNGASEANNTQSKVLFNQAMMNGQIQKDAIEADNQLKGDAGKLYSVDKNDVIKQIVSKVKVDIKGEGSEIRIRLKPDFLGEMSLKLSLDKGVISAKAIVQDYQVKQLIESNISQLRSNLEEQGISIADFEVSVGDDSSFERQGMNWNRQNNRRFNTFKPEENEKEYGSYLNGVFDNDPSLDLDGINVRRSSINLMA